MTHPTAAPTQTAAANAFTGRDANGRAKNGTLAFLANATTAYPLLFAAVLYGQYLLSWALLGHAPRPSLDDPKYIDGASWMHDITGLLLLGYVPTFLVGAMLNALLPLLQNGSPWRAVARLFVFVVVWVGVGLMLSMDPGAVLNWWLD